VKDLKPDYTAIQKAMEDTERQAFDYFLDLESGRVVILSEEIIAKARELLCAAFDGDEETYEEVETDEEVELPDWMEEEVDLALDLFIHDRGRYLRIPERDPRDCHAAMTAFAEQIQDKDLRGRLVSLLDGPGAFRRFKDALAVHARERKLWHGFNARCARKEIDRWLSSASGTAPE